MLTRTIIWNIQAHTPTTYNRIKVTDMTARMIPVETYGLCTIVHNKPRPFHRLRWTITVERGGAYCDHGSVYLCTMEFIYL